MFTTLFELGYQELQWNKLKLTKVNETEIHKHNTPFVAGFVFEAAHVISSVTQGSSLQLQLSSFAFVG